MIQRKQTLFLLLIAILMTIFPFMLLWKKIGHQNNLLIFKGIGLENINLKDNIQLIKKFPYAIIAILSFLSSIIASIEIFLYNNRIIQNKLGKINGFLMFLILVFIIIFSIKTIDRVQDLRLENLGMGIFFIIISFLTNLLASYFIKKDEELVRSADRLR